MTNEEKIIAEKLGKENPFRVPEGYFDHFAEQFMNELPERQVVVPAHRSRLKVLRPILMASLVSRYTSTVHKMFQSRHQLLPPTPSMKHTWTRQPTM